nr:hypothetical protein CFP56_33104 [Quercus suber]
MLGTEIAVSMELEATRGAQGGLGLSEEVEEGWEDETKGLQGGQDSIGTSGMLIGVTNESIAKTEATSSASKGLERFPLLLCVRGFRFLVVVVEAWAMVEIPLMLTVFSLPFSTYSLQLTLQLTAFSLLPSAYYLQLTVFSLLPSAYYLQLTVFSLLPSAYYLQLIVFSLLPSAYCLQLRD